MNTVFQQAISKLQREVEESKAPQPEVEKTMVGKFGITRKEISENVVEVGQVVQAR